MGRVRQRRRSLWVAALVSAGASASLFVTGASSAQPPPPAPLGHVTIREKDGHALHAVVDGVDCGPLPWEGTLEVGSHQVYGHGEAFSAPRRSFTVVAGASTDVELDAEARPAPGADAPAANRERPPQSASSSADGVGFFGGVLAHLLFEPGGTQSDVCSAPMITACSTSAPIGGGLMGYVGYQADPIGVDVLFGFQGDAAGMSGKVQSRSLSLTVPSIGGIAAVRARLAWRSPSVGVSLAAGVGGALRDIGVIGIGVNSVTYFSPAITVEGAVHFRLGGPTALSIGLMFWGENAGHSATLKPPPLTTAVHVARSTQAFLFPFLGLEFGP